MQTLEREQVEAVELTGTGSRGPSPTSVGTVLRWTIAALMLGAGAIHFGMMGGHAGVSWSHGLFFASAAWLQLGLAAMIGFRPTRPVIAVGIVLNIGLLVLYVLTRIFTISFIDGTPEAWGNTDRLCAVFEILAVLASFALLNKSIARRPLSATVGFSGVGFIVVLVAVLTSMIFSPAASAGGGGGTSADGHNHGASGEDAGGGAGHHAAMVPGSGGLVDTGNGFIVAGALTGDSPCERSGPPASEGQTGKDAEGHAHRGPFKQEPLTQAEAIELQAQQAIARDVAVKYPNVAAAEAAGYHKSTVYVPCIGAHYTNIGLVPKFDPAAPSELLFDGDTPDAKIVGLSYLVLHPNGPPEGFAGPNDRWHQHNFNGGLCLKGGLVVGAEDTSPKECAARGGRKVPLPDIWMVHDWVVPGWECSWGVFAGECPELGGRTGGTAFDAPDPRSAGEVQAASSK